MNKRELRKIIREKLSQESKETMINEGLLRKFLLTLLSPLIRREANKIKNSPEMKAAEEAVKIAVEQWEMAIKQSVEISADRAKRAEQNRKEADELSKYLKSKYPD